MVGAMGLGGKLGAALATLTGRGALGAGGVGAGVGLGAGVGEGACLGVGDGFWATCCDGLGWGLCCGRDCERDGGAGLALG